ncbi:histone-lysine N-methyltransferase SETD1-like [Rhizophagus clarus]|uniref:Histone-lysine N-methyltransferase, H3 lysine-4 specific n=1 Tax=Rhizophagus clarus TaxID=94130 RepID=A0A8H3L500_9GLOM|nr:histone-lysine N-methyltransferase SETD1-like [Rhizophagus clarus]
MEPSNLESQPNIKETFPEYFPILEVDNKSRLILKHYKPRLRSFSAPATSHVQVEHEDREDIRKDVQEDFIILHDPKLTPETLQRSISLTRNGDQFYTQRYLKSLQILKYESDGNANKPKEASVFISQLDKIVTEHQLQIPFEECGNVLYCKIEKSQIHNHSLGLARLTFYGENDGDALNAARDSIFKFNGKQLFNGPPIKLELDNDGSKLKAAADAIIAENQRSLEPFINNKMREPSPLPNDDDMEIGDAPSPPAVIGSIPITKTSSASQYSEPEKTKKKSVPDNRSHVSPEKYEQKVESVSKKPIDDDKEEGEIDSNYEDESLFGPISGHSSSRDKGRWFERYPIDSNSQYLDYSILTVVPSKRSYDQYIPDYSNDRNRNQERRRRNSSRERFIRNNLNIERSRSRSRGRSPIGNSSQQRSRDRDYGRGRNYDSVRNRDRDSVQIYNRDSSRSHDRDISRIHDRSTTRDNDRFVFRNNDREVIRSGREIYKEAYSDDKKSEVNETRDYWTTEKYDGTKSSSVEIPPRDHAKYRKKSQLNKDSLLKSLNESKSRIHNDIPMKFENKDNILNSSLSIKRKESSHLSRYEFGLSEDKGNSNSKKPLQKINSPKVESVGKHVNVNRPTKHKSYQQPSSKIFEGYRKPNISDWDYSSSDSSDETDKDRKRNKAQDIKRKPLPKNIASTSTRVDDNKKLDNDEKKRNQTLQQKKFSQKQISKPSTQNVAESTTKSKILRKSKNVDITVINTNKEADISLPESIKTVRKQKIIPVSNIKTNLEASGSSDMSKQKHSRKLKEGVTNVKSQPSNDNIRRIINRSSNDVIISSETSDSDNESANNEEEYVDRDYLTSGDEIADAYDLDMIRLYLELNEKGLLGSDGEPIEWSENEEEFTIRVGDHVESFKDYAPDDGPHKTGCARTEGYYKIPPEEKRKYVAYGIPGTSYATDKAPAPSSRASRAKRRELQSRMAEYQDVATDADILLYNPLKAREKELTIAKSKIHHYGLFALERIKANEFVIQYTGELIRQAVADLRERKYKAEGIDGSYMFRVGDDTIIDATKMGNNARLINHSCDPNCNAKILTIKGKKKIAIYAKRDIEFGEEITYDYKFPIDKHDKIPCHCGASNCRGSLN